MGVWIETQEEKAALQKLESHPVWVCGLKLSRTPRSLKEICHTLYGCVD